MRQKYGANLGVVQVFFMRLDVLCVAFGLSPKGRFTTHSTTMKSIQFLLFSLLGTALWAQDNSCDGYRYRYLGAFPDIDVEYDIPYGGNVNAMGMEESLVFDLYTPKATTTRQGHWC